LFGRGLGDEKAVERVAVMPRQARKGGGMLCRGAEDALALDDARGIQSSVRGRLLSAG
jgi:hypothetical protein